MSMYCGGHGHTLPCPECAENLRRRIERDAMGEPWKGVDYAIRRLQADIDDGSRPDQWSMEDIVRGLQPALAALAETQRSSHTAGSDEKAPSAPPSALREALIDIARQVESLKRECGMDPESPTAIHNGALMSVSYRLRALVPAASSPSSVLGEERDSGLSDRAVAQAVQRPVDGDRE